jgi:hypothetical protein
MQMTNRRPENWRELQELVAYYFNYSGYEAEVSKTIKTVRGQVEIDVFVKARKELGENIICECKFWNTPIPQEKIHAFRTVVNDSGASLGIIISKIGFQSGAYLAAENSNVKLLTWEEFLDLLFEKWFDFRKKRLLRIIQPLMVYTDPYDVPTEMFSPDQTKEYKDSLKKYIPTYIIGSSINKDFINNYKKTFKEEIQSYEEYFDNMEKKGSEAVLYYENFFSGFDIPE